MKLRFLGTGAAEGVPALWCTCGHCQAARQERGRSIRLRSALLIDDRLLVDCGPDLIAATAWHGLDLSGVRTLLITHEHDDHLDLLNLEVRSEGFCATPLPNLHVYGSAGAMALIRGSHLSEDQMRLRTHVVGAFDNWETDGYRFAALRAKHGSPSMEPLLYAIADALGTAVLYAHDTGPFPEETWAYLANPLVGSRWAFDVVSLDATNGVLDHIGESHMSVAQVVEHRRRLAVAGLLKPGARVLANHFSHAGAPAHSQLAARLLTLGIEPTHDGLTVEA